MFLPNVDCTESCYPRESEGICFHRRWFMCLCVCLSVTTITKKIVDGFAPNFMRSLLGGRPGSCFVTIVRVMWKWQSKNSVNWRLFNSSVMKFGTSGPQNSRCGKCCRVLATITLSHGFVLSESFPSSFWWVCYKSQQDFTAPPTSLKEIWKCVAADLSLLIINLNWYASSLSIWMSQHITLNVLFLLYGL